MAVTKRQRFEIFKRDNFICRYCGQRTTKVILEIDHIVPRSKGGTDDEMNLVTSCFDCNRGKSDVNLSEIITGEDPHDKALELIERERQLAEYNYIRYTAEQRVTKEAREINEILGLNGYWINILKQALQNHSKFDVFNALEITIDKKGRHSEGSPYFWAVLRNITSPQPFPKKAANNG